MSDIAAKMIQWYMAKDDEKVFCSTHMIISLNIQVEIFICDQIFEKGFYICIQFYNFKEDFVYGYNMLNATSMNFFCKF